MIKAHKTRKAVFASGCFWGTQYYLGRIDGVIGTTVGYCGGEVENPTYEEVCAGNTGHLEAVEVKYDPNEVSYEKLTKMFFETHDPTQVGGQGPDIGSQYQSVIFYGNEGEKEIAQKLIDILNNKGMKIATELKPASKFWPAEDYHQNYYAKNGQSPYCHIYKKLF
jgi:peptide methionine sulfoxide reductase msrA/msrB